MWNSVPVLPSLKLTVRTWNGWLEDGVSFWGPAYFQRRLLLVSGSVSNYLGSNFPIVPTPECFCCRNSGGFPLKIKTPFGEFLGDPTSSSSNRPSTSKLSGYHPWRIFSQNPGYLLVFFGGEILPSYIGIIICPGWAVIHLSSDHFTPVGSVTRKTYQFWQKFWLSIEDPGFWVIISQAIKQGSRH